MDDAVKDGFLVPAKAVSVPLKFQREGITYADLSEEEKEQWDALEWDEDGSTPDRVEAEAVNKWLFNKDTVDKVLEHLMTRGQTVASGDRLGKTIVFAKNQAHAEFIAQRFDVNYPHHKGAFARVVLILNLQLAVLRAEPAFQRLSDQLKAIAGLLEEKASIPMVRQQLPLIQEIQSDDWWQDVTTPMLEHARTRLRALVKLVDKQKRAFIYTDFEDQMGGESAVDLPGFDAPDSFERFRAKARAFLKEHEDHITIHKLRMNKALTRSDLDELERMLTTSGVGGAGHVQHIQKAKEESRGLGLFVRSLVGLDREAAKQAFAGFLTGKTLNANQIEFVDLIVNHLTEHGVMGAALLYESPFTDVTPTGPDALFTASQLDELLAVLDQVRAAALAA